MRAAGNPKDYFRVQRHAHRASASTRALNRLTEAVAAYQPADEKLSTIAYNWQFLAMAHQRLGHVEEAKKWHEKAAQWIDQEMRKKPEDPAAETGG